MWLNPFQWAFNFLQVVINGYILYIVSKLYRSAHTHDDDDVQPK